MLRESRHATRSSGCLSLAEAQTQFAGGHGYLAACTGGLPTRRTMDATRANLALWEKGAASTAYYDDIVERTRRSYAALVGVGGDEVAIGSQASVLAAMIADSVPDGATVLCVHGDFSSMVFPFLQQSHRGVSVKHVNLDELPDHIDDSTWLVSYSLVQSGSGRIADYAAISEAAARTGAYVVCDTTQAAGWMPVDAQAFDATICHAYKWLCAPRGVAFLTVSPEFAQALRPVQAGWCAARDPWQSCYGPHMRLAENARRFDVSPAWQAWVGAEPAIEMFSRLPMNEVQAYDARLGNLLCHELGVPANDQAIVTWPDADGDDLRSLSAAGIVASGRAGNARVAFHLWNDETDVEALLSALKR